MSPNLKQLINQVKSQSPLERPQITLPLTDGADVGEIFDRFLDPSNILFLSFLRGRQIPTMAVGIGLSQIQDMNDEKAFLEIVLSHYLMLTVTEKGYRSDALTKIASGYLQMQQEIEIEQEKKDQSLLDRLRGGKR